MNWEVIKKLAISTASGDPEVVNLEYSKENGFRIINEYGNECLTFDIMTGLEFFSKINEAAQDKINAEINTQIEKNCYVDAYSLDGFNSGDCEGNING